MFEIAWSELFVIIIVAIIVVGPKELPGMLRSLGRMMGKLRRSADDFRRQFEDSVREAGGEDLQRELHELRRNNPLNQIRDTIEEAAREPPTRPPTPDAQLAAPPDPVTPEARVEDNLLSTKPEVVAMTASAPPTPPAPAVSPTPAPAPAVTEQALSSKEPNGSAASHEPLANGQHRPLS
jgi:sec-independent protein translocase protein TatB